MKLKVFFLLLLVIGVIIGCQDDKSNTKKGTEKVVTEPEKNRVVKEIVLSEAPSDITSPSEAVVYQYGVVFENGEKEFPTKDSIISETTLGDRSIVTIHSPEGKNKYTVFLYENKGHWTMTDLMQLETLKDDQFAEKTGLNLPMEEFNIGRMMLNVNDNEDIWAFVNENNIITIARLNRFPFREPLGTTNVRLKRGAKGYLSNGPNGNSFLYYFDSQKIVILAGNISKSEIISLANSMPSVTSPFFPTSKK
ncbi:hypothetical protein NC797_10430 [Aquibacillus sp. 3ASR75-11]|uniref:DUF4367 domain-containing protein n=1 Tax=Terrihalobacillus insolitus TaxID=2950438 RepID=A0A9X3WVE2_9BACI|nr:hypothetical protein [Terrihalobacillus insolitus]MDC3413343.1 hypothetical protein [Terrihalobacillus insolitus]MDC3424926.1 hypothetical protein [Terrihalobacillus insolitus]